MFCIANTTKHCLDEIQSYKERVKVFGKRLKPGRSITFISKDFKLYQTAT